MKACKLCDKLGIKPEKRCCDLTRRKNKDMEVKR